MDPGQHDVRCHWAERDRVVPDARDVLVGSPVVGDQLGLRGYGAEHKRVDLLLAKALDHLQPGASRLAATLRELDKFRAELICARNSNGRRASARQLPGGSTVPIAVDGLPTTRGEALPASNALLASTSLVSPLRVRTTTFEPSML